MGNAEFYKVQIFIDNLVVSNAKFIKFKFLLIFWLWVMQVPAYIAAQTVGSLCAAFALKIVFHPMMGGGVTVPSPSVGYAQAFALEFIISFNLMFVVTAVATDTRAVSHLFNFNFPD